jgi:hypothetical protein
MFCLALTLMIKCFDAVDHAQEHLMEVRGRPRLL